MTCRDKEWFIYTFIKTDNTAAALYILNIITVQTINWITINVMEKSPSHKANSCSGTHSIPCFFYRTCKFIAISTTAWLTSSHLIPLATYLLFSHVQSGPKKCIHMTWKILLYCIYTKAKLIWEMSLNFLFNVGVWSGHHRHPNTVEGPELLQEGIHFFGPLCILHWTISLLQPICLVHFKGHADINGR